eukprot:sb/3473082/
MICVRRPDRKNGLTWPTNAYQVQSDPDLPEPRYTGTPIYREDKFPPIYEMNDISVFHPDIPDTPIYRAKSFPPRIPVNRGPNVVCYPPICISIGGGSLASLLSRTLPGAVSVYFRPISIGPSDVKSGREPELRVIQACRGSFESGGAKFFWSRDMT